MSENTTGCDLLLHCRKSHEAAAAMSTPAPAAVSLDSFLGSIDVTEYVVAYQHVNRADEIDYRRLYSDWLASRLVDAAETVDFAQFRAACRGETRAHLAGRIGKGEAICGRFLCTPWAVWPK